MQYSKASDPAHITVLQVGLIGTQDRVCIPRMVVQHACSSKRLCRAVLWHLLVQCSVRNQEIEQVDILLKEYPGIILGVDICLHLGGMPVQIP